MFYLWPVNIPSSFPMATWNNASEYFTKPYPAFHWSLVHWKPEHINPDDFKNDPLIQKALELFKGRIVEVRK